MQEKIKDDLISRQAAIDVLRTCYDTEAITYTNGNEYINYEQALDLMECLPHVEPETSKRVIGKSRDGMTMWYMCDRCGEPIDVKDVFCSGCGRRLTDG